MDTYKFEVNVSIDSGAIVTVSYRNYRAKLRSFMRLSRLL